MAGEGITFKTFGSEGSGAPTGDQTPAPLGGSFAERAAKIKERMATQDTSGGAPNRAVAYGNAMLENLSNGRAPQGEIPAADYAKMSWGEYLPKVGENLVPSSIEALKGMGNAIIHPVETASAIGQIGQGLGSKALDTAGEAIGYGPVLDPAKKAEREAMANALLQSYSGRYGGGEEGEFWKHLAEDPASYLTDVASVASLGAGSATKLGLLDKASKAGKVAKFAENLDPVQAAMNLTGKAASTVGKVVPYGLMLGQNAFSGIPLKILNTARQAALSGDPKKIEAFMSSIKGNPNFSGEAIDALEGSIDNMAEKASNSYMTDRKTAFARTEPVDMEDPTAARNVVEDMITPQGVLQAPVAYAPDDMKEARAALDQIDNVLTHPSGNANTIQELDVVKKNIDKIAKRIADPALRSRVQAMSGELVDAMAFTDPAYGKMMRGWSEWKRQLNNVRKEFGTKAMSDVARTRKLARAFSSKSGNEMFNRLEGTPSGENLRYSLAGDAMKTYSSDRIHNLVAGLGGLGGIGLAMGYHPAAALAAVPPALLASPKLGGLSQYALGRAERAVNTKARGAADLLAPPVMTNVASQVGSALEDNRQGRKSGGRVSSHDADADQLVRAAERAKKGWSAETEPLLNQTDDAVAHALEVANRSI
jgi:hypothetical protein